MTALDELGEIVKTNYLDALREASAKITPWSEIAPSGCDELKNVPVQRGSLLMFNVWRDANVSMCRAFMSNGTILQQHTHEEREVLGVMSGCIVIQFEGGEQREVEQYGVVEIPPQMPHTVAVIGDTWVWGVTMPPGEGYPGGAQ